AFFCLLFFAAAKKSRCCPAQGRRMKYKHRIADASESKGKNKGKSKSKSKSRTKPSEDKKTNPSQTDK
ncbi:hypothetical protein, partial [Paraburkholderia sp. C35]|uniref:hypothetical protein n=1 Tax=Paraburkholderia sp. C35 TaxID=2126993 RepID=UPI00194EEDBE